MVSHTKMVAAILFNSEYISKKEATGFVSGLDVE